MHSAVSALLVVLSLSVRVYERNEQGEIEDYRTWAASSTDGDVPCSRAAAPLTAFLTSGRAVCT